MNYALPVTHKAIALSVVSRRQKNGNARPWHGAPLRPRDRRGRASSREMELGVREKDQVHSRSQRTSRRPHELGSARLLVKFYQTWGARLFASAGASPFFSPPAIRIFLR